MLTFPDTPEKLRKKIATCRRKLQKQQEKFGSIYDSAGDRLWLFWYYLVLDDRKVFGDYMTWYEAEFPDDAGESLQLLCWAIGLRRLGQTDNARRRLADAIFANLYLIPFVLDRPFTRHDMRHGSNFQEPEHLTYLPIEVFGAITAEERAWIAEEFDSSLFSDARERYIAIYKELQNTRDLAKRSRLVDEARGLRGRF
jgi:hypothetical protein